MAKSSAVPASGSVKTRHLEGNIIETVYVGHISVEMADEVRKSLTRLLPDYPRVDWLIDATEATGIAPAPRNLTLGVVDLFRTSGGRRIAMVVRASAIRMLSTTFAFAFGLPLKSFENRADALEYLRAPG